MDQSGDVSTADDTTEIGLAKNRSRREKKDRHGRKTAFEQFREARSGQRSRYAILEERNIYEEVDEEEYSRIVRDRQDDDWIVDDGTGYVEDGREIFDEEPDAAVAVGKRKSSSNAKPAKNPNIRPTDSKPAGIRGMFAAAAAKPKVQKAVSLDDDDILGDIMGELKKGDAQAIRPAPVKMLRQVEPASLSTKVDRVPVQNNGFAGRKHHGTGIVDKKPSHQSNSKSAISSKVPSGGSKFSNRFMTSTEQSDRVKSANVRNDKSVHQMKSDNLLSESEQIQEFVSQDLPSHHSAAIEDYDDEMDISAACSEVDVSGIDFNDNFEQDVPMHKLTDISTGNGELKETKVTELTDMEECKLSSWQCDIDAIPEVSIDASSLPLVEVNGESILRLYWIDAFEEGLKQPGVVFLFGKVWADSAKQHVSCCLSIKNVERCVYLLPRRYRVNIKTTEEDQSRPITFLDVYQEFSEVTAERYKIMKFKSLKVTRSYAFSEKDVPAESEYLEVKYSAEFPVLPTDLVGETFSHVFGANKSALETFILDRRIKGPCWLDVSSPQVSTPSISWCRLEASVSKLDHVSISDSSKLSPPQLVVLALSLRTAPHRQTHQNELTAAACLVHRNFPLDRSAPKPPFQSHFCAVAAPSESVFPFDFRDCISGKSKTPVSMKVEMMSSERALINYILAKIHKVDPDVIVGHDVVGYDMDVLLHRIAAAKISHWSKVGRLKRATVPKFGARSGAAAGRLMLDTMISAKELIRCRSYDLTELASHVLKEHRQVYEPDEVRSAFSDTTSLLGLLESTLLDATYSLRIAGDLNALPLAAQITNVCGNVLSRTLAGGRSERNEYLLLHAFTECGYIVPDKVYGKRPVHRVDDHDDETELDVGAGKGKAGRRKPAYTGGLVLEPKRGFYDKYVLLVDFNSLYPSIIQEYNICFTTVASSSPDAVQAAVDDEDYDESLLPEPGLDPGILPTEIRRLVESRRQVRQLMKASGLSADLHAQYDIRQRALKLTANSLYGCLGFTHSRFYAKRLAALVTGKGREILMKTRDLVQAMNLDVIYGDTDSLMIATGTLDIDEVYRLGNRVKSEVNKLYKHLEIDIDGVFRSMLLLKKKKYAALSIQKVGDDLVTSQELKGLDIVRRDWCTLAKETGSYVVSQILSGDSRETVVEAIHSRLMEISNAVRSGEIPLESFQITKQLTKNPEDYPDRKSLPHVQVALRLNTSAGSSGRKLRSGDAVVYVVCDDGSSLPATQRAYHPDLEVAKRSDLTIDARYYLEHQVHPVVARLCDPVDGTDAARIAECLGIDASHFRKALRQDEDDDAALIGVTEESELEKYRDCEELKFPCPGCGGDVKISIVQDSSESALENCPGCKMSPLDNVAYVRNQLTQAMRRHVSRYYEGWQVCEDPACGMRTRQTPLVVSRGQPVCSACRRSVLRLEVSERSLYRQLGYYQHCFDTAKVAQSETLPAFVGNLKSDVDKVVEKSAYSEVNLSRLFEGLFPQ